MITTNNKQISITAAFLAASFGIFGLSCGSSTNTSSNQSAQDPQTQHTEQGARYTAQAMGAAFVDGDSSTFCSIATGGFMGYYGLSRSTCLSELSAKSQWYRNIAQQTDATGDYGLMVALRDNAGSAEIQMTSDGASLSTQGAHLFMTWDGTKWTIGSQG